MLILMAFNTKKLLTYPEVLELTGAAFIFARFLLHPERSRAEGPHLNAVPPLSQHPHQEVTAASYLCHIIFMVMILII
jgi:hypothetical protein